MTADVADEQVVRGPDGAPVRRVKPDPDLAIEPGPDRYDDTGWPERELGRAIASGELAVRYQPIVELPERRIVAVEALVTWDHPERGMVPPDRFIGAAEACGLIGALGEWVMETACRQVREWQLACPDLRHLRVAVNVSAHQLDAGLPETVLAILRRTGLAPECLEIEVTESAVIADLQGALRVLDAIGRLGVGLSIDDFGTGFSSLAHLKQLPVTALKIDKAFIDDLSDDPRDVSIVAAIIALAAALGLSQIAEGVETEGQLQKLEELGCAHAQGYLFSRPLWPADFRERVAPLLSGEQPAPARDRQVPRVLVCDDEASIRKLYRRALQPCDVDLLDAVDAEDCLNKVASFAPNLLVLDVTLPGRDGLEVLDDIRRLSPETRVIVISGLVTASTIETALERGAEACVGKMQFLPRLRTIVGEIVP